MALSGGQKNFIKKNVWQSTPAEIAAALGLPEREIHDYLKKRWRPEKYQKYVKRLNAEENPLLGSFSLKKFIFENRYAILLLVALVFVTYVNSLKNDFVSDDIAAFPKNPDLGSWHYLFATPMGFIIRIFNNVGFKIAGLNPAAFRLSNIIFHLGTVVLIFLILSLTSRKKTFALMGAALVAVHPLLAESITWISGSPYSLYGCLFLLSLATYILSSENRRFYYISIVAFFFTVTSNEKAIVLPLMFPLYEIAFGNFRTNWKKSWPYFAMSFAFGVYFLSQVSHRVNILASDYYLAPGKDSLFIKIPTSVYSYLRIIFWPDHFSLYHTEMVFTTAQYYGTILIFLLYFAAIIFFAFWKKNRAMAFWLTLFLIPLLPTLSPLRIAWAVAERYAYLSALGILVVIAWIFYKISTYEKLKIPVYALFSMIIIALSARTMVRNTDWKNEETLWTETEKTSPSGPNIHNNMGSIYQQKGQTQKAIDEFKLAIQINPQYADAYHNLANTYQQAGDVPDALQNYQQAVALNPRLWQSHQNLAAIYFAQGWYDQAQAEIKKALELNPTDQNLQQNLALIERNMQNPQLQNVIQNTK